MSINRTEDTTPDWIIDGGEINWATHVLRALQNALPMRVAVLPETESRETRDILNRLEIRQITFRWVEEKPKFDGLEFILGKEVGYGF